MRTFKKYAPRKQELMNERIEHLKQKKQEEYERCVKLAADEFEKIGKEAKHDALMFLEIKEKVYEDTLAEAKETPQLMVQMQKSEARIRLSLEEKREITESRDVLKTIIMEKI